MSYDEDGTKKVRIDINRSAELEALRKEKDDEIDRLKTELEEKKNIIEQEALTELEKEKKAVLELLNQSDLSYEQRAAIEDKLENPANLELVKSMLGVKSTKKRAPYGKSTILPSNSGGAENTIILLDQIYDKIQHPQKYSSIEVEQAKAQRDTLLTSMIEGPSFQDLKEHGSKPVEKHSFMTCPKCGATLMDTEKCYACNED